jgi:hypothetical protein
MTPLIHVKRLEITDSMLIASDVPETDYPAWSNSTTYALGDRVILTSTHKIYESIQAGNLNKNPAADDVAWWSEVSPTNKWKLFDTSNSTATAKSTSFYYTLRPAQGVNALAALNLTGANSIRIRVTHPTLGTLYDKTQALASLPASVGWWEWFFSTRKAPSVAIATDLPAIPGCDIRVDFEGTTALSVGVLLVGVQKSIGIAVQQGARIGITDYSRKETNAFGDTVLVQRAYAKRASFDVPILSGDVDDVVDYLASVRAVPSLWIGSGLYGSTVVFGFYKDFEVNLAYRAVSECSISIEGMT